jgi:hypothetical protein
MREMQEPLSQAQKEQAELEAAKSRWERAKQVEKSVVTKRQAEQAAVYAKEDKRRRSQDDREDTAKNGERKGSDTSDDVKKRHHSRSLSVDKLGPLGGLGTSSKRLSAMKVEDWQRYQQEQSDRAAGSTSKRDSRGVRSSVISPVPFPNQSRRDSGYDRRKADRSSGLPRDPPN